jgi:hypothetical protein
VVSRRGRLRVSASGLYYSLGGFGVLTRVCDRLRDRYGLHIRKDRQFRKSRGFERGGDGRDANFPVKASQEFAGFVRDGFLDV